MYQKILTRVVQSILIVIFSGEAAAQMMPNPYGFPVNLDAARKVAAAAVEEAKKNNWNVAVAIVDNNGDLIYFERMDNTQIGSVKVAQDKARTAALFKRPSKAFEDAVSSGRNAVLRLSGATPIEGGIPLLMDGKIVGGIGVSGALSAQDAQCARAGADILK
jgi:uncharacterized protein GlcG (DUF336 family)